MKLEFKAVDNTVIRCMYILYINITFNGIEFTCDLGIPAELCSLVKVNIQN